MSDAAEADRISESCAVRGNGGFLSRLLDMVRGRAPASDEAADTAANLRADKTAPMPRAWPSPR